MLFYLAACTVVYVYCNYCTCSNVVRVLVAYSYVSHQRACSKSRFTNLYYNIIKYSWMNFVDNTIDYLCIIFRSSHQIDTTFWQWDTWGGSGSSDGKNSAYPPAFVTQLESNLLEFHQSIWHEKTMFQQLSSGTGCIDKFCCFNTTLDWWQINTLL